MINDILKNVSADRLKHDLFYLSQDPLPFRKVNYTRPGQSIHSLAEADRFIQSEVESAGYSITSTSHRVQAFRCDETKPIHHWYAMPEPSDPWYDASDLEISKVGTKHPDEIIQLISHKDSMSWIDSPGAHDNAVGTVANLELARLIAPQTTKRTIRTLFCNEEHNPWTSPIAAQAAAERNDNLIAVLNIDSLTGKSDAERAANKQMHTVCYSTDEGRSLAEFMAACGEKYHLGLEIPLFFKDPPNDDDGMFIKAGFPRTVMNVGTFPYTDSEYHLPGDIPKRVNIENVVRSVQLLLAVILEIDAHGIEILNA